MFQLMICSFDDMAKCREAFKPTHTISIVDGNYDVGDTDLKVRIDNIASPMPGLVHPQPRHLESILAFTEDLGDNDRVLIHCSAGQSRSTAAAIAVLIQHHLTPEEAFAVVSELQPNLLPNMRLIEYADHYFGLDGVLIRLVDRHRRESLARLLNLGTASQGLEEMKSFIAAV
jgi:predicted protein tyrosine phosphatase